MEYRTLFVLDPGHGIDVPGKRSPQIPPGFEEWRFVRDIADRIVGRKNPLDNFEVTNVLYGAVSPSKKMSLKGRVAAANTLAENNPGQAYFISLHTNAAGKPGWGEANGTTAFVAKDASSYSRAAAQILCDRISAKNGTKNRGVFVGGEKRGGGKVPNFYVLKHTYCPAVLVEILFHTSKFDCEIARLKKNDIADAFLCAFREIASFA